MVQRWNLGVRALRVAALVLLCAMAVITAGCGGGVTNVAAPTGAAEAPSSGPFTATLQQSKRESSVDVCHAVEGPAQFVLLTVANASLQSHLQHGDGLVGDPVPNRIGMSFDASCRPTASCTAAPGTPGFLGWTAAGLPSGSVQLLWEPATGAVTSYVVGVGTSIGGTDVALVDTGSTATAYTLSGLTPSIDYYHARVRARNACGTSAPSNEANPRIF